jgi:hypothetical protein
MTLDYRIADPKNLLTFGGLKPVRQWRIVRGGRKKSSAAAAAAVKNTQRSRHYMAGSLG